MKTKSSQILDASASAIPQPSNSKPFATLGETLLFILTLLAFLPYIRTSPLGSDVQPHYFAIFPIVLFIFHKRLPIVLASSIYLVVLIATGIYLKMSALELIAFGSMYVSIFLISGADDRQRLTICWAVRFAMVLYLGGVILELVGIESILDQSVSNRRGQGNRGCSSFASEPSFLGFVGLAGFIVLFKNGNKNWILDSCVPWLVIFSSGSVAAIAPGVAVILAANLRSIRALVATSAVIVALLITAFAFFDNSRFVRLAKEFYHSPASAVEISSGANRLFRGVGPTYYGIKNGLMPNQTTHLDEVFREMKFLRDDVRITRISNLGGQLFFIFGLLSLPIIATYLFQLRQFQVNEIVFVLLTASVFSFSLITTSTPYMHWVLASLLWPTVKQLPFFPDEEIQVEFK